MRHLLWLAILTLVTSGVARGEDVKAIGRRVDDFALRDHRGKEHKLADLADSPLVVIAFLGTDCPLAKRYAPRLEQLAQEYADKHVAFLAIDANRQDTLAKIAAYARQHELTIPVLKDGDQRVAEQFAATRTPEVFVLDRDRTIRYHGRIDDQFTPSHQRPAATRRDLASAIDELLAGREVRVPETPLVGCLIGREPRREPTGDITYANQIVRVLNQRCVECHRPGQIAPFPLTSYDDAVSWADTMLEVVDEGRMPPWSASPEHGKFANDARMTDHEKQLLHDWVANGCPQGDPKQLPQPPKFADGWRIPTPDAVFYMTDKPVDVPAEGTVEYRYFNVDPGFTEDKWIQAIEPRPGNAAVVHHVAVGFEEPSLLGGSSNVEGGPVAYGPGVPPYRYPEGSALFVAAGSRLSFQVHYTPNGSPQQDRSYVGMVFADPAKVRHRIYDGMARNQDFVIPPEARDFEVQSSTTINRDSRLLTLMPHMHMRGKSFRYEAQYPDGRREVLLDVPRYDFNWQMRYDLAEPKLVPKGTQLLCTGRFDNSEQNLSNPDPTKAVRWGDQTFEEMMVGHFTAESVEENRPAR